MIIRFYKKMHVYKKYVFPIKTVAESATELVLTIDDEFINSIVGKSAAGIAGLSATTASAVAGLHIEVHPRITIEPNHQATTIVDPIDGFNAYAIVEPIFDSSASPKVYKVSDPGRPQNMFHDTSLKCTVKSRELLT